MTTIPLPSRPPSRLLLQCSTLRAVICPSPSSQHSNTRSLPPLHPQLPDQPIAAVLPALLLRTTKVFYLLSSGICIFLRQSLKGKWRLSRTLVQTRFLLMFYSPLCLYDDSFWIRPNCVSFCFHEGDLHQHVWIFSTSSCVFLLKVERLVEEKECSLPAADALQMSYSRSCIWPPAVTAEEIARRDISISREWTPFFYFCFCGYNCPVSCRFFFFLSTDLIGWAPLTAFVWK